MGVWMIVISNVVFFFIWSLTGSLNRCSWYRRGASLKFLTNLPSPMHESPQLSNPKGIFCLSSSGLFDKILLRNWTYFIAHSGIPNSSGLSVRENECCGAGCILLHKYVRIERTVKLGKLSMLRLSIDSMLLPAEGSHIFITQVEECELWELTILQEPWAFEFIVIQT